MTDTELEERVTAMLRERADQATPHPALDAVRVGARSLGLAGGDVPKPRGRTLVAAAAAALVLGGVIVGVTANRSNDRVAPASSPTFLSTCMVFLPPTATPEDVEAIGSRLQARAGIAELRYLSQTDAYDEFATLFADEPELVRSVGPAVLPSSWRFSSLDLATDAQFALAAELRGPSVLEVRCGPYGERPEPMYPSGTTLEVPPGPGPTR